MLSRCWRPVLAALVALAVGWPTSAAGSTSGWRWPLAGVPTVLRPFQPPPTPYAAGHRGVDLAAPAGAAVLAAGAGVVGYAGPLAGRGVVTVVHGALRTTYEPVAAVVRPGQPVGAGELIGRVQPATGHCGPGRPCLHWGLLRGDVYLDPLALLGLSHPILLPMGGGPPVAGPGRLVVGAVGPERAAARPPPAGAPPEAPGRPPPWLPLGGTALVIGAGVLPAWHRSRWRT